jgi:hypothetical protein
MQVIKPPDIIPDNLACIFLAGSIEMDRAELWQDQAIRLLGDTNWTILNPRRDEWDSTWEQKISNPKFYEQVNWELQGIEVAEKIIMYFDPATKSPITLLELGLITGSNPEKLIVICPEGFWRKGNVDMVCARYQLQTALDIETAISYLPEQ